LGSRFGLKVLGDADGERMGLAVTIHAKTISKSQLFFTWYLSVVVILMRSNLMAKLLKIKKLMVRVFDGYFFHTWFWQMGYEGTKLNGILGWRKVKKVVFNGKRLKDILQHSHI
jgi:hypothetical protein